MILMTSATSEAWNSLYPISAMVLMSLRISAANLSFWFCQSRYSASVLGGTLSSIQSSSYFARLANSIRCSAAASLRSAYLGACATEAFKTSSPISFRSFEIHPFEQPSSFAMAVGPAPSSYISFTTARSILAVGIRNLLSTFPGFWKQYGNIGNIWAEVSRIRKR